MSKHAYSPKSGEWRSVHHNWECSSVVDSAGIVVAEVRIDPRVDEDTQDEYEAEKDSRCERLAAMPDLAEALQAAYEYIMSEAEKRNYDPPVPSELVADMSAALKRAGVE